MVLDAHHDKSIAGDNLASAAQENYLLRCAVVQVKKPRRDRRAKMRRASANRSFAKPHSTAEPTLYPLKRLRVARARTQCFRSANHANYTMSVYPTLSPTNIFADQ